MPVGLAVNSQTTTSVPLSLGFQLDRTLPIADGWTLQPSLRTAWVHEFDTSRNLTASFQAIPGPSFEVTGAAAAANSALIKGSVYLAHGPGLALFASVEGNLSGVGNSVGGDLGLEITW